VAAGVGYENAETSTITVKTYDAKNGEILSDETYELNVREDAASAGSQPRERIFAGGVGPGTDGLSAFTLRVYDSATGRFLWEGFLNLSAGDQESSSTHRVVAHLVAPKATVTQVRSQGAIDGQPQFFLRAVDSVTGQLVWTDQFSAGAGTFARAERVGRAAVGQTEGLAALSQQIEFRIRMMDDRDQEIMWEDTIEPTVEETDMVAGHDDAAENLPVWRGEGPEAMKKEAI
jgi:outer membrane protein assembly factor BamB